MIYAVDRYMDVLKLKTERETIPDFGGKRQDKYHYFDTEHEAKSFIVERAKKRALHALKEYKAAHTRYQRILRKFISNATPVRTDK